MIALLNEVRNLVLDLWDTGSFWARLAIVLIAGWPFAITLVAFVGWPALTATVALVPLLAIAFWLFALFDPMVIAAIGIVWPRFLKTMALVVGTELAFGVYFTIVPVTNDRALIPLALLLLLAIAFLAMSGSVKRVMSALVIAFVVLTAVFALGGRDEAKEKYKDAKATVTEWAKPTPTAAASAQEFRFDAGEEVLTVVVGSGTRHRVWSNKPFEALSRETDGSQLPFRFPAGESVIAGQDPAGQARLRGLEDGTVVRFESLR